MNITTKDKEEVGPTPERAPHARGGPLGGVRVADFTWVAAGPLATRFLADMGAQVIKIEGVRGAASRIDMTRRVPIVRGQKALAVGHEVHNFDLNSSGMFNNYNRNKLAVSINMSASKGRDLCERLIAKCDIAVENFAPGVMERWGLTYKRINALSPNIIYARMSGFGHSGPYERFRSFGPVVQAVCGLSHISGLPGGGMPSGWGMSYMDNQGAYHATNAILAALYRRNETGDGTLIDLSAVEAGVSLIGPKMLDVTVNGATTRGGNFPCANQLPDQIVAPHGVYPSKGDDIWIAIAVMDDNQWGALKSIMGNPDWAANPLLDTAAGRHAAHAELDCRVSEWTKSHDNHQLAHRLQAAGITAQAVQNEADKESDPQLRARGLYFNLDHPVCGRSRFEGIPIKFSRTEIPLWRSAPMMGEDNIYVFKEVLGLSDHEFDELKEEGII